VAARRTPADLYGVLIGRSKPRWKRERWDTPDGDFIDVDRLAGPAEAPLVVLFHGLEGDSSSHYARALARELRQQAWRGAVPHFRVAPATEQTAASLSLGRCRGDRLDPSALAR